MKFPKYARKVNLFVSILLILLFLMTSCGKNEDKNEAEDSGNAANAENIEESEIGEKAIGQDGTFVSEDGKIEITFPDADWTCVSDTDNMKTFQSDSAVITIIYAEGDEIGTTMVPADEDAYRLMVNGGMADLEFDVVNFESNSSDGVSTYKGTVHYTGADNPDKYTVHYGIYRESSGYTATAVLSVEDEALLEQVQNAVYSMKVGQ